jgi:hypothetical protein
MDKRIKTVWLVLRNINIFAGSDSALGHHEIKLVLFSRTV